MESYLAVIADFCKRLLKWEMFIIIKLKPLYIYISNILRFFNAEERLEVKKCINSSRS